MMLRVALVLSLGAQLVEARDSVSFSFGWKHRTGLSAWAKPDDPPPANPDPGPTPPESKQEYSDSDWERVQLPHDGLIAAAPSEKACPDGCSGRSYIPRHVLWYRKSFNLPSDWKGDAVWLDFAGSFRETTVWINGFLAAKHDCGYTPFRVRLDNITTIKMGGANEIAVFVDPDNGDTGARDHGSGWWYEGGGLYRNVKLVHTSAVHIEQDGLFAYSNLTFSSSDSDSEATGVIHAKAAITNGGTKPASVCVVFNVTAPDGSLAAKSAGKATMTVQPGASATATAAMPVASPKLWSSSSPTLYKVGATVHEGACTTGALLDVVSAPHGFRHLRYDANDGFFLNQKHFKVSTDTVSLPSRLSGGELLAPGSIV